MNAVDTNVLIYAVDLQDPRKYKIARQLLRSLRADRPQAALPWQVVAEYLKFLRERQRKGSIAATAATRNLRFLRKLFAVPLPTHAVIDRSVELFDRYSLSHWDCMLVAACLEAGIDCLYTEDMGSPRTIETMRLVNPFA
jgi:predicted nucleic acid-binding protein